MWIIYRDIWDSPAANAMRCRFSSEADNEGRSEFFEEVFKVSKRRLPEETLISNGFLPHEPFKNITRVGLRLNQYSWVKAFLEQNQPQLHPDNRENACSKKLMGLRKSRGAADPAI